MNIINEFLQRDMDLEERELSEDEILEEIEFHESRLEELKDQLSTGVLNEAQKRKARNKRILVKKQSQLNRAGGHAATMMARKRNDPMYKRYVYHNKKRLELKAKLQRKYGRRVDHSDRY